MNFDDLQERHEMLNTVEYKGYFIREGSVSKNGECLLMAHCPAFPTQAEKDALLADAKEWIDADIAKRPEVEIV